MRKPLESLQDSNQRDSIVGQGIGKCHSTMPAHGITAQIKDTTGATINLAARAPQPAP